MCPVRLVLFAALGTAIAAPVTADVTVRSTVVQEGTYNLTSEVTEYRKGLKMRTDSVAPGMTNASIIVDAGTGRTLMLWHDSKTATEHDFYAPPRGPAPANGSTPPPSIIRTSQTRTIAGSTCTVYRFRSSAPLGGFEMSEPATMVMEGTMCLVKDGPVQADFLRIHRAIAERRGKSDPMLMTGLQAIALGVPFASDATMSVGGTAPNAEMREIGRQSMEVTSISTESIPDSVFEIPPGYTVTKR